MSTTQPHLMLNALQGSIDRLRKSNPLHFATCAPYRLLVLAAYNTGALHATSEIATGSPSPDLYPSDLSYICELLTSYIQVEQLKLKRNIRLDIDYPSPMGGDAPTAPNPTDKFNVLKIRERAGFTGPVTSIEESTVDGLDEFERTREDPEPFDEFTGPMGGAR